MKQLVNVKGLQFKVLHFLVEQPQIAITSDNATVDAGSTVIFACVGFMVHQTLILPGPEVATS